MVQRVDIDYDFTLPVERVYAYLAAHENLGPLFGATVSRVRDGDLERDGTGSVRSLKVGPLPAFEETVTRAVPNEIIEYRITRGGVLRGHNATMQFSARPGGSHLRYVIEFGTKVPGTGRLVRSGLERNIRKGLATVDAQA